MRFVCGECGLWEPFAGTCAVDGQPLESTDDPLVGSEVGAYRLLRVVGQGGMGRVYAAVHQTSGSRVAIKLITEKLAKDRELLERFFAEARAVNLIRHENIVNIIDLAELADGRPYIVMELITGQTLRQLATATAPLGGLVQVMIEVLAGLAAAHAIGIVHRDLKPDNILVTASGHAKILDFGIAKLTATLPGAPALRTQTGVVLGTPEYMAPEMIVGAAVDGRADLYAIGLILYELVIGRRPFEGGSGFDVMKAHVEAAVVPPRQLRPELPDALDRVIVRALEKRPADRFESAAAMQKALRRVALAFAGEHRRPMLGGWLPPVAMTGSLNAAVTARNTARTVRASPRSRPGPEDGSDRSASDQTGLEGRDTATSPDGRDARNRRHDPGSHAPRNTTNTVGLGADAADGRRGGSTSPDGREPPLLKGRGAPAASSERRRLVLPGAIGLVACAGIAVVLARGRSAEPAPADPVPSTTAVARHETLHAPETRIAEPPTEPTPALQPRPRDERAKRVTTTAATDPTLVSDRTILLDIPAESRRIEPADFDWRGYVAHAETLARRFAGDAKLVAIRLEPVGRDGRVDLTSGGSGEFVFRSRERARSDGGCNVIVVVDPSVSFRIENEDCAAPFIHVPPCGAREIRARADTVVDERVQLVLGAKGWVVNGATQTQRVLGCP